MFSFFTARSCGWISLILSTLIMGLVYYAIFCSGLTGSETRKELLALSAFGVGGMLLGSGLLYFRAR